MTDREKEQWESERAKGFGRYLWQRGLLLYGLTFASLMALVRVFLFHKSVLPLEIFLFKFIASAVLFGGFMGITTWWLNENDYQKPSEDDDGDGD